MRVIIFISILFFNFYAYSVESSSENISLPEIEAMLTSDFSDRQIVIFIKNGLYSESLNVRNKTYIELGEFLSSFSDEFVQFTQNQIVELIYENKNLNVTGNLLAISLIVSSMDRFLYGSRSNAIRHILDLMSDLQSLELKTHIETEVYKSVIYRFNLDSRIRELFKSST